MPANSLNAWEIAASRLFSSFQNGGQWTGHPLNMVRFAEPGGCEDDSHRPKDWRYRGYGVSGLRDARPYKEIP